MNQGRVRSLAELVATSTEASCFVRLLGAQDIFEVTVHAETWPCQPCSYKKHLLELGIGSCGCGNFRADSWRNKPTGYFAWGSDTLSAAEVGALLDTFLDSFDQETRLRLSRPAV